MNFSRFSIAVLWATLVFSGCVSPPRAEVVAAGHAGVTVANQTDYTWRITVRSSEGDEVFASRVPPRASVAMEVAGGDYTIEQAMLLPGGGAGTSRVLSVRLEAGQIYRWPLATMLSTPGPGESAVVTNREPGT